MEKQEEKGAESVRQIMNNTVQYFDSLRSSTPRHDVNLSDMAKHIRSNEQLKTLTEAYRNATSDEQRKSIKQTTGAFLAAAKVEGARRVKCITAMTGISLCDIDHIPAERLPEMVRLAQADAHTLLSYVTLSGRGLRILFRYELDTAQPLESQKSFYKSAYRCGNSYYARLLSATYDDSCSDAVRLNALCHDDAVYYNAESTSFTAKEVLQCARGERLIRTKTAKINKVFNQLCKPRLEAAAVEFVSGSHNNYVMRIGYMMNEYGIPLDDAVAWASTKFGADYPQAGDIVANCYAAQPDEFGKSASHVDRLNARKTQFSDNGYATVEEIEQFLAANVVTRRNVLRDRLEVKRVGEGDEKFRYITDSDVKSLWVRMSHQSRVKLTDIFNVLESDYSAPYNPIHDYLNSLPKWDESQPDYLAELAQTVTVEGGEAEQQRFAEYLKKWIVGMIASWLRPDVVNHVVLVFIGEQGSYKSTWFNLLPPLPLRQYYTLKFDSTNLTKDDLILLSENILVCLEEIDTMSERTSNFFKATITATTTNIRAAYGRYAEQRIHVASYCGTGNNPQFLNDAVSRRWLPFMVKSIVSPVEHPFNHDGIFSQALYLYQSGFRYWFNKPEIDVLKVHNREFQAPCMEEELISVCFRKPGPEEIGQFFPTSLVLKYIADNIGSKLNVVKVGKAMGEIGFERKKNHGQKGWICIPLNAEEIIENRKRMAMHAEKE
jgi:hypothetical protein